MQTRADVMRFLELDTKLQLLLDELGIEPDGRLTAEDLAGLPRPEKAWDD